MTTANEITVTTTPATSAPATTNTVILVGTLVNASRRPGQREARVIRRGELRSAYAGFGLEIESPFGGSFVVDLEASTRVAGYELLSRGNIDKPIVVEGFIRRRAQTDRRYAVNDSDLGARLTETRIEVLRIREAREEEEPGTSFVALEGTINTSPRLMVHRTLTDIEMVRTVVQVVVERASGYNGSQMIIPQTMQVSVVMPLIASDVRKLWVPGNKVRIVGQVDMNLVPQTRNEAAQTKLAALDAAWPEQREALEQIADEAERGRQLRAALGRYRSQRAAMVEQPAITVVVGGVELLKGREATEGDLRRTVRSVTTSTRRKAAAYVALGLVATAEDTAAPAPAPTPAPATEKQPAPNGSRRPRRQSEPTVAITPVVTEASAEDAGEPVELAQVVAEASAEPAHTDNGVHVEA